MKVRSHRLCDDSGKEVPFRKTPNQGGSITPSLLVMHFTAGASAESSIDWLRNPRSKASAHLLVARDGAITQLVAFNRRAWHAGESVWKGRRSCNDFAIGIELDNAGKLTRKNGRWVSSFGQTYPDDEVLVATHKNENREAGWHRYTPEQLRSAREAAVAIVREYGLTEIVGHEDISPGRKNDPGPAFPMEAFQTEVLGMATGEEVEVRPAVAPDYVVSAETAIRANPSPRSRKRRKKPLPKGTIVRPLPQDWWLVELVEPKKKRKTRGWVRISDLIRADQIPTVPAEAIPEVPRRPDAERRLAIARKIVDFEARRDRNGKIAVYELPSGDGGGSYEVAGINQRYHPAQAAKLRELIREGKQDEAEDLAAQYIADYTDLVAGWTTVPSVEAFLRDSAFNRGPGGAAKILQIALGVETDGRVGPITIEALRKAEQDPESLLEALRKARETYELRVVGRRPKFWNGLVNRWNKALSFARTVT